MVWAAAAAIESRKNVRRRAVFFADTFAGIDVSVLMNGSKKLQWQSLSQPLTANGEDGGLKFAAAS
jgi:hypothetical protein